MRKYISIFTLVILPFLAFSQSVEKDGISQAIQKGDAHDLAAYFSASIDLTLLDNEDVYSDKQAEVIFNQFFADNKPKTFELKHEGKSKVEDYYYIGVLKTTNGDYRLTFFLKKEASAFKVKQIRIEPNS
jgi:hypothetical protein